MVWRSLLDPVDGTFRIVRRLQENETFRSYLDERKLSALPLVVGAILTSATFAVATAAFVAGTNGAIALLVMLTVVPMVLIGSLWVQAHALLSWLEERSLVKHLPGGRSRNRGPVNQWLVRRFRIDMGPPPQVPWIPALVFFLLPAAVLAQVSAPIAEGLAAVLLAAAITYAARDPVIPAGHARGRREPAPMAAATTRMASNPRETDDLDFAALARTVRNSKEAADLDFTSPKLQSRLDGAIGRVRSLTASSLRRISYRLRSLGKLLLVNIPPLAEYAALGAGIFFAASSRQSGSGQDLVLGISFIGAALLFAGVASIVTRRMSFRFFRRAHSGYAGAPALITGMMQVVAGGLALAAALAHANQTWDANLQALVTNPWPLLTPLGLLLIGAGLLLMYRPHRRIGPVGILLYVVPKALAGAVVFGTGIAILAGWAWKIYDPNAFLGFVQLYLDGNMHHLERGWHAVIVWLR